MISGLDQRDRGDLTLNSPGLVGAQHDVDHKGELGGALAEGLDEPQHAEVVGQVDGVLGALLLLPPDPEALPYGRDVPAGWEHVRGRGRLRANRRVPLRANLSRSIDSHLFGAV